MTFAKTALAVGAGLFVGGICCVGGFLFFVSAAESGALRQEADYRAMLHVEVTEFELSKSGYDRIRGKVTNNGNRVVSYWEVTLRVLDAKGVVVDTDRVNSAVDLMPGDTKTWSELVPSNPKSKRVEATLEKVNTR
ncbi:MAG: FxLYD domain-containing protein [Myxococcales bacterium]|nr:FxLYD domain-containing protein [Myxococcales bacterium]